MPVTVHLNADEIEELMKQDPATAKDGGFQNFLVKLQQKADPTTGELALGDDDLERIHDYISKYKTGGWQSRLKRIFERSLGPSLGAPPPKGAASTA